MDISTTILVETVENGIESPDGDLVEMGNISTAQTTPESGGTPILTPENSESPATTPGLNTPADNNNPVETKSNDAINAITAVESTITSAETQVSDTPVEIAETSQKVVTAEATAGTDETKSDETTTKADSTPETSTDSTAQKSKRPKARVVRTDHEGIYTIKHLESSNFFLEWYRGFIISSPYMLRLIKIFWSLSPSRAAILLSSNLLKAVLPSIQIWVTKQFLDAVEKASSDSKAVKNVKGLLLLGLLRVGTRMSEQVLEIISDKVGGVMETRLARELDFKLIDAYLKLESSQLDKPRIRELFGKVYMPMYGYGI